jgi:hypothetical protein
MPRPYEEGPCFVGATHESPSIRRRTLKEGEACLAPTNNEVSCDVRLHPCGRVASESARHIR